MHMNRQRSLRAQVDADHTLRYDLRTGTLSMELEKTHSLSALRPVLVGRSDMYIYI